VYKESKILTIYSSPNREDGLNQKRTSDILHEIELINLYLKDFKNGVCDKILSSTIELVYQSQNLNVSEEVLETVLLNINNIFVDNKITVFLNSENVRLIDIYAEGFRDSLKEVNILIDDNIDVGTCKFDYDFTEIKTDILGCLKKSQLLIDNYKEKKFVPHEYLDLQVVNRRRVKNESEIVKKVREVNLSKLCNILTNEDTYVIAVVLMNLNVLKTIELLWRFPINLRYEVIHRLLTTKQISKEMVEIVFKTVISEIKVNKAVFNENIKQNYLAKRRHENSAFSLVKKKY
jgi:hypothetical protein